METTLIPNGKQLVLIAGCYRCDNCGRDVERTQKSRRFRLCDECWAAIIPDFEGDAITAEQREAIGRYWGWYNALERRLPPKRVYGNPKTPTPPEADDYYPLCECGCRRAESISAADNRGLFGGPFLQYCPVCQAKREVESVIRMAHAIHPDWDDEEWLDLLYKSLPRAFELGVLPDYWYELRSAQ